MSCFPFLLNFTEAFAPQSQEERMARLQARSIFYPINRYKIVYRPKEGTHFSLVEHAGIYFPELGWVFDFTQKGFRLRTREEFSPNNEPMRFGPELEFTDAMHQRLRNLTSAPQKYDESTNNCEHMVNMIIHNERKSDQSQGWWLLGGTVTVFVVCLFCQRAS